MAHKSIYLVENVQKYKGDAKSIVCRSSWERACCKYFDSNPDIKYWASEEIVIPYTCQTDLKKHRYYMDFYVEKTNGKKFIIEVKPKAQTQPPKPPKSGRITKSYKMAQETFKKNASKWKAANDFALMNGMTFAIWTEDTLKQLGIRI